MRQSLFGIPIYMDDSLSQDQWKLIGNLIQDEVIQPARIWQAYKEAVIRDRQKRRALVLSWQGVWMWR